jgi:hypothetical protein
VTQIDQQAFQSCSVLKYVIIPSSAITISTNLFHDASQAYIYAEADSEMAKYLADSNKNASNNPSVIVPKGGTVEGTEDGNIIFTLPGVDNPVVVPPGAKVEAGEDGKIEVTLPGANSAIVVAPGSKVDMSGTVTDVWPPALTAGAVSRTGNTAATVKFTSSEAGEYYYAVVEKDEAAPTIDTATGTACDTAEQTINLSTLDAGAKDIYIVVKDAADNTSSATFKIAIPAYIPSAPRYTLTVENGTGGGSFIAGTSVSITANTPEDGKVFDTWTTSDGVTFADPSNSTTSFTMPAKAVTVTANYKDDPNGGGDDPNPPVEPPVADNGWVYENDVWKFFIDDVAQTGWVYDDAWYYLNADGIMQTGWVYDTDYKAWYYLAGNGAMKTGWVQTDGSWYYLAGNGAMVAAKWFHDTDGSWYYLSGNGKMLTGKQSIGGKTYAFKANGVWIS